MDIANKKVPGKDITLDVLGGGSFLLEFSTVIVIVFVLLILGYLQVLEEKRDCHYIGCHRRLCTRKSKIRLRIQRNMTDAT
jgi:hypothetical protein